MRTKVCPICERELPATLEFFHRRRASTDGWHRHCKECRNAYRRERYKNDAAFREGIKDRVHAWYQDNLEYARETARTYAREHMQEAVERSRRWREENPERYHASLTYEARREHFETRREYYKAIVRNYQARKRDAEGQHTDEDVQALYEEQEGKCAYCGIELGDDFHVDHVIPLSRGGANSPDNLALACVFCNCSKSGQLLEEWHPIS